MRDPEWVVKQWLTALDGLEGRRRDRESAQHALSFLMRLEQDPFYASPEQTRGGEKDSSGLVYSLALLLFERLTGHHPFIESLSPLECRIQRDRAKRVGKNNLCHLSSRLRAILNVALSPFAEDRYQDVAALRADVERWQRGLNPELCRNLELAQGSHSSLSMVSERELESHPEVQGRRQVSDTLDGAVLVVDNGPAPSSIEIPGHSQAGARLARPWLWPTISGAFALVATMALFVAYKSNTSESAETAQAKSSLRRASDSALQLPAPGRDLPADARARAGATTESVALATPAADDNDVDNADDHADDNAVIEFSEDEALELSAPSAGTDEQAVAVARRCISAGAFHGGMDLGVSVLFDAEGQATRSFTGKLSIKAAEMACLREGMATLSTSDPAQMGRMVRFDMYMSASAERVRSRLEK